MTNVSEIVKQFDLKPKEITFLHYHLVIGLSLSASYREIKFVKPQTKDESTRRSASRFFARIKQKIDWPQLLELAGIGLDRVILELNDKLTAKKTEFHQGIAVAECEDNGTQMRALELLAELHGLKKREIKFKGEIKTRAKPDLSKLSHSELDELERITEKACNGQASRN